LPEDAQRAKPTPLALEAYEALAEAYAARIDTKPHNAYYDRPATLSLLPDVDGKRVLDAGCGPGAYAQWLVDHGAEVLALDVSPKMVRFARRRLGTRATVLQADFSQPLDFLPDASFDVVLSALALDYVADWRAVFREFHRLLRRAGWFIFSVGHPFADFARHNDGDYFDTELVEEEWTGFGTPARVRFYRRSLQEVLNPLLEAGFVLDSILEPQPTSEFQRAAPDDYEVLCRQPGFLCVCAVKPAEKSSGA
jgi:SAM-dependent methyltransferase